MLLHSQLIMLFVEFLLQPKPEVQFCPISIAILRAKFILFVFKHHLGFVDFIVFLLNCYLVVECLLFYLKLEVKDFLLQLILLLFEL